MVGVREEGRRGREHSAYCYLDEDRLFSKANSRRVERGGDDRVTFFSSSSFFFFFWKTVLDVENGERGWEARGIPPLFASQFV